MGRYLEAVEQYRQALTLAPPQFAPRLRKNRGSRRSISPVNTPR